MTNRYKIMQLDFESSEAIRKVKKLKPKEDE